MRRGRVLLAVLLVGAVGSAPWWGRALLLPLDYFALRRLEVVGVRYFRPADVAAALGLPNGASVFEDLGALERRLNAVRGIEEARVERRLPGTLRVTVREAEPVAMAQGPRGLVPLARDGRALPYDLTVAPVDAPLVRRVEARLVDALATVQAAELELFAAVTGARLVGGDVELELGEGRVLLETPVDAEVVRRVSAVRRDLAARGRAWRELDARFGSWVIVRPAREAAPASRGGSIAA